MDTTKQKELPTHPGSDSGAKQRGWGTTLRALRHRNFRLFISGQLISVIGTWMQSIAQDWLVYRLTGSSLLLGIVAFVNQIPILLLSPATGFLVDRHDRHRIIVATQSVSMVLALILATLTLTGRVRVWEIMILASLLGVVNAFDIPARQSFLIEMVGREDLLNAIGLNSAMFNGARVVGPAIAGILVAAIGEGWCFFANGVSYIAVIAGLLMMRLGPRPVRAVDGSPFQNVMEGLRFAKGAAPIRALLLLIGMTSLAVTPYSILMPIFAGRILHGDARTLGILMGATGVGALIGALTVASKTGVQGLGRWVWMGGTGLGAGLILFSTSRHLVLSLLPLAAAGFCVMLQASSVNTLLQSMVPDRLRGRVMALYSMMFVGMTPIGALLAGVVADKVGAPVTVAIGGAICVGGALLFARHLPSIRGEARQLLHEQGMIPGDPPSPAAIPPA